MSKFITHYVIKICTLIGDYYHGNSNVLLSAFGCYCNNNSNRGAIPIHAADVAVNIFVRIEYIKSARMKLFIGIKYASLNVLHEINPFLLCLPHYDVICI